MCALFCVLSAPVSAEPWQHVEEVLSGVCANYLAEPDPDAMLRGALVGLAQVSPSVSFDAGSNKTLYRLRLRRQVVLSLAHPDDVDGLIESVSKAIERLHQKAHVPAQVLSDAALRGAVAALGNCYTVYLSRDMVRRLSHLPGETPADVGISLSCKQSGLVRSVRPRSAAFGGSIIPGDILRSVDDQSCQGLNNAEIYALLSGPTGTEVKLGLRRANGVELSVLLHRENPVMNKPVMQLLDQGNIAYLRPGNFHEHSSEWARSQLNCAAIRGLILDLRGNGGGRVDEAEPLASLFLDPGPITSIQGRGKRSMGQLRTAKAGPCAKIKLAILVDGETASAAELVAQALRERRHAPLIGQPTYGKGSVQQFLRFADGSVAKVTTARYLSPSGKPLDQNLQPDILLPTCGATLVDGDNPSLDPTVQRALKVLSQ